MGRVSVPDDGKVTLTPFTRAVLKYIGGFGQNISGGTVEELAKRICADFERSSTAVRATGIEVGRIVSSMAGKVCAKIRTRR